MKKYICLNHGECNWADEKPPRDFTLPEIDENACPNCGSGNIKEKPTASGPPWPKIAGVVGLLLLVLGIIWLFTRPDTLTVQADSNCKARLVTLTSTGGDESPITYSAEGLKSLQGGIFKIPENQLKGSTLVFHATQNGETVNFSYKIDCDPISTGGESENPRGPDEDSENPIRKSTPKWTQVAGSEFCVGDCIVAYSEIDNLGHTRERRVENYEKCCPADK